MVCVPLKVKHVSCKFILSVLPLLFHHNDAIFTSFRLRLFIFVTLIVSSCTLPMVSPVTHAHPAELMSAQLTSHMVAPLVLLYGFVTGWTGLGKG